MAVQVELGSEEKLQIVQMCSQTNTTTGKYEKQTSLIICVDCIVCFFQDYLQYNKCVDDAESSKQVIMYKVLC